MLVNLHRKIEWIFDRWAESVRRYVRYAAEPPQTAEIELAGVGRALVDCLVHQKISFSANWRIRGSSALLITPKVGLFTVVPGAPRLA